MLFQFCYKGCVIFHIFFRFKTKKNKKQKQSTNLGFFLKISNQLFTAMSDEEDFMGDLSKFIPKGQDVRPGLKRVSRLCLGLQRAEFHKNYFPFFRLMRLRENTKS